MMSKIMLWVTFVSLLPMTLHIVVRILACTFALGKKAETTILGAHAGGSAVWHRDHLDIRQTGGTRHVL